MRWAAILALAGLGAAGSAAPLGAQTPPAHRVDLAEVGRPASAGVLAYRALGPCEEATRPTCDLESPQGVVFAVRLGQVCDISVAADRVKLPMELPYGLVFGASLEQAIAALPKGIGEGRVFEHHGRKGYETGEGDLPGMARDAGILLWFDGDDRLMALQSSANCE